MKPKHSPYSGLFTTLIRDAMEYEKKRRWSDDADSRIIIPTSNHGPTAVELCGVVVDSRRIGQKS